jgi:hypothetical protein
MPAVDTLDAPEVPLFKAAPGKRTIVTLFRFVDLVAGAILAIGSAKPRDLVCLFRDISQQSPG